MGTCATRHVIFLSVSLSERKITFWRASCDSTCNLHKNLHDCLELKEHGLLHDLLFYVFPLTKVYGSINIHPDYQTYIAGISSEYADIDYSNLTLLQITEHIFSPCFYVKHMRDGSLHLYRFEDFLLEETR